jgi:hypothetical protein
VLRERQRIATKASRAHAPARDRLESVQHRVFNPTRLTLRGRNSCVSTRGFAVLLKMGEWTKVHYP